MNKHSRIELGALHTQRDRQTDKPNYSYPRCACMTRLLTIIRNKYTAILQLVSNYNNIRIHNKRNTKWRVYKHPSFMVMMHIQQWCPGRSPSDSSNRNCWLPVPLQKLYCKQQYTCVEPHVQVNWLCLEVL